MFNTNSAQPAIGDQHEIDLTGLTYSASAVGRINDIVTFVKDGAPDETARVEITAIKKRHIHAKLIEILSPSPHRCPPPCPYFIAGCGGCQWQHVNYNTQLASKRQVLIETLHRIGGLTDLPDPTLHPAPQPLAYRNNVRLTITSIRPQIESGFKLEGSHNIIPIDWCKIAHTAINQALPQVANLIADCQLFLVEEFTLRTSVTTGEVMLLLIYSKKHKPRLNFTAADLGEYSAIQSIFTKSGEKGEAIWVAGKKTISETVGDLTYEIGPETFFQNNFAGLEQLMEIVRQHIKASEPRFAIDAHCGTGTFTLPMAQSTRSVLGVDLQPKSIVLAQKNAQRNGITNTAFRVGHLAQIDRIKADFVILNPPRQGCWSEDLRAIKHISPNHLLYISCNPTTLARDLAKLKTAYQICALDLVDLFPMTYHFETVVLLQKRD